MAYILALAFSIALVIYYCCGLRAFLERGESYHEDHFGPEQRAKGLLVKKEISSYRPMAGTFRHPSYSTHQKILFLSTFQIDGETVLFYSDSVIYDKLKEGKTYRLRYQGNRIVSVKKGKG